MNMGSPEEILAQQRDENWRELISCVHVGGAGCRDTSLNSCSAKENSHEK
jgi:hypothetical protein